MTIETVSQSKEIKEAVWLVIEGRSARFPGLQNKGMRSS